MDASFPIYAIPEPNDPEDIDNTSLPEDSRFIDHIGCTKDILDIFSMNLVQKGEILVSVDKQGKILKMGKLLPLLDE